MKKRKIILLFALILIISLGLFYVYKINVFDQNTLKTIDIRTTGLSDPTVYTLDKNTSDMLFSSLSSITASDIDSSIALEGATEFDMSLINRWDLTKNYQIYITDTQSIFLKIDNDKLIYKVDDRNFFFTHEGFDALYSNKMFPEFNATLNQKPVFYEMTNVLWSFQRFDKTWHEKTPEPVMTTLEKAKLTDASSVLGLNIDKLPSKATLKIVDTKTKAIAFDAQVNIMTLPVPEYDGDFIYELSLTWSGDSKGYIGFSTLLIPVEIDLPESFVLSKTIITQGELVTIDAFHIKDIEKITLDQKLTTNFKWFVSENSMKGYLATNYLTKIGTYTLTFKNIDTDVSSIYEIEVVPRNFLLQKLIVDQNVEATTRTDDAYAEYRNIYVPSLSVSAPQRYYSEPFIFPTMGRLNTEFGEMRSVNGSMTTYRHDGIDIGAKSGSKVVATNSGKVVLSTKLILTGNTIVIDHGEGLFSVYKHLDHLNVALDDLVERGQLIGNVGSTGFSTGPHLHFSLSYYAINLEPGYFIYGQALTKENYLDLIK